MSLGYPLLPAGAAVVKVVTGRRLPIDARRCVAHAGVVVERVVVDHVARQELARLLVGCEIEKAST